jgi:hypothetical protein
VVASVVKTPTKLGGAARDLRIDFFRGLALYMIVLDHSNHLAAVAHGTRKKLRQSMSGSPPVKPRDCLPCQ